MSRCTNYLNYSINKNSCYILIIPGFGIISTVISASSNKNVFGQDGPLTEERLALQLSQQTICRKFKNWCIIFSNSLLQITKNVSNLSDSILVRIFVILNNPQITKARRIFFKSEIRNFFGLSMLVGISEAIRLLSTYFVLFGTKKDALRGNLIKKSVS